MTEVAGTVKQVGQGLTQKTYSYEPLDALVDIVTNTAGRSNTLLFRSSEFANALYRSSCSGHSPEAFLFQRERFFHALCNCNTRHAAYQLVHQYGVGLIVVARK